jgi:hypothetical protein
MDADFRGWEADKSNCQMRGCDADVGRQFRHVFSLLEQLFTPSAGKRRPIGFHACR